MEPIIDFTKIADEKKTEITIPKKPLLIYKPTAFNPSQIKDNSVFNIQIKKRWILYLFVIIILFGIGLVGFIIGKFL
ncbi:MAG: hypothetical protein GON13_00055 [Nanoarchaeota archaeon]|nr:hypothetical protein [Nanoarchaeota archaeon]